MYTYIVGERCSGKTTVLKKRAQANGSLFVTSNSYTRDKVTRENINAVTIRDLLNGKFKGNTNIHHEVVIDELNMFLRAVMDYAGVKCLNISATINDEGNIFFLKKEDV